MDLRLILFFSLLFLVGLDAKADVKSSTQEGQVLGIISSCISWYAHSHDGKLPSSWEELNAITPIEDICREYLGEPAQYVEDRYQFLPESAVTSNGVRLVLVRTLPFDKGSGELQRIVITRDPKNGWILAKARAEQTVQKMLKEAGITVTPKAGLAAVDVITPSPSPTPKSSPSTASTSFDQSLGSPQFSEKEPERPLFIALIALVVAIVIVAGVALARARRR